MSQTDKLIARIRRRPPEADFADVRRLLHVFGWHEDRQRGRHVMFVKPGEFPLVIPLVQGRKVKRTYLDKICEHLHLDEWEESD